MRLIICTNDAENVDTNIGRVYLNLHSIELYLRVFLYLNRVGNKKASEFNRGLDKLKEGEVVEANEITNYDQFSTLIDNYNSVVKNLNKELVINENILDLRHALAHGRAFTIEPFTPDKDPMTLLKFIDPKDNPTTSVQYCKLMTKQWFNEQIKMTKLVKSKVIEACGLAAINHP